MSLLVCWGRGGGVSSAWGKQVRTSFEVIFVGLVVGENYVCSLVTVGIFMGFGGAKWWGNVLKSSFGVAMLATRMDIFYEEGVF